jgi:asparaginyl-tRNA synthetase
MELLDLPKPIHELTPTELARKQVISNITTKALAFLTSEFVSRGFDWLLPVVFSKSTDPLWPDPGASIEKRVETEIYGEIVRTTQSMIIHKLVACSTAYPKFFILSPNIRIEKRERKATGWHSYEFTQLDFEIRNGTFEDVKELVESVVAGLIDHLKTNAKEELLSLKRFDNLETPRRPFEVFDRIDLVSRYGEGEWERELAKEIRGPVWITNIPREFYDYEEFTSHKWDNYDLFVPIYGEILSGARREWEYQKILSKLERDGINKQNYSLLLRLSESGSLRPSAGAGIGIERLITWIVGSKHIGEVQPFPKIPGLVHEL